MMQISVCFWIGESEPDSYLMAVDLSSILSAVSSKLHTWSSHVMWLFIFQMEDPSRQAHSHTWSMHVCIGTVSGRTHKERHTKWEPHWAVGRSLLLSETNLEWMNYICLFSLSSSRVKSFCFIIHNTAVPLGFPKKKDLLIATWQLAITLACLSNIIILWLWVSF